MPVLASEARITNPTPPQEVPIPEEPAPTDRTPGVSAPDPKTAGETPPEGSAAEGLTLHELRANLRSSPTAADA